MKTTSKQEQNARAFAEKTANKNSKYIDETASKLHEAAKNNEVEVVDRLLHETKVTYKQDRTIDILFKKALEQNNTDLINVIFDHLDETVPTYTSTVPQAALKQDNTQFLKRFLPYTNKGKRTIHKALKNGAVQCLELVLNYIDDFDRQGRGHNILQKWANADNFSVLYTVIKNSSFFETTRINGEEVPSLLVQELTKISRELIENRNKSGFNQLLDKNLFATIDTLETNHSNIFKLPAIGWIDEYRAVLNQLPNGVKSLKRYGYNKSDSINHPLQYYFDQKSSRNSDETVSKEELKTLVNAGVDLPIEDTAFKHDVLRAVSPNGLRWLINEHGYNIKSKQMYKGAEYHETYNNGIFQTLVSESSYTAEDSVLQRTMIKAAENGAYKKIDYLLNNTALTPDIKAKGFKLDGTVYPHEAAIMRRRFDCAKKIIDAGAPVTPKIANRALANTDIGSGYNSQSADLDIWLRNGIDFADLDSAIQDKLLDYEMYRQVVKDIEGETSFVASKL